MRLQGLWRFVSVLAALRRDFADLICPPLNFGAVDPLQREVRWHGAAPGSEVDWQNLSGGAVPTNAIAFSVRAADTGRSLFCVFNPYDEPVTMALPGVELNGSWRLVVDTARLPPEDANLDGPVLPYGQPVVEVAPKAGLLLVSVPTGATSSRAATGAARAAPSAPQPGFGSSMRPPAAGIKRAV